MMQSEEAVNTFLSCLFKDMEEIMNELDDKSEELQKEIKKRDFNRCIEISAEIIACCGSIFPLQNLKESIELALNKDKLQ